MDQQQGVLVGHGLDLSGCFTSFAMTRQSQ
jgi:hypothetical protein